ncbi:1,6-anhydro-N-acetylmuramyl-L-alanine amidase AmpD [Gallaecimonas kandeliae]|uniref:1,6-anhydro-N-acetylmuramyl-L-alanine amidase AmpD n=1 Tax=Gallaecimonas kandeliae TaxID=3029055 RepID=UPI002648643D|nr:1,6-anhydro-N-acetylmuramyl-L-alanine amidase AmpD [Gallaecimonas kandeliae]WKE66108.1 1,6-anhydro-N-acetylmuramyl-L-alanine amidase AmpD [Gallaecimonas kandeliae]
MSSDWYPKAVRQPSPHQDDRPAGAAADLLVLHNISLPPNAFGAGHIQRFFAGSLDSTCHPWFERLNGVRVSAHFLIERSGAITQFVPLSKRAWHAGLSYFQGRERLNDYSVGVELEGADHLPFTAEQYRALAGLSGWLFEHSEIGPGQVTAHETIAPFRKSDPGPLFDWLTYYRELESRP